MPTMCCFDMLISSQVHCCTEVLSVLTLHVKYSVAAIRAYNASCKALAIAISLADADDVFRLLHLTVAVLFSEQIQKDLAVLKAGKPSDVSLAAKWAPTPGSKLPAPRHPLCREHIACCLQLPLVIAAMWPVCVRLCLCLSMNRADIRLLHSCLLNTLHHQGHLHMLEQLAT